MWLTRNVFPALRNHVETLGFHLSVLDLPGPQKCQSVPKIHLHQLAKAAMQDGIDIWLVFFFFSFYMI
jgi:hypothetical protein